MMETSLFSKLRNFLLISLVVLLFTTCRGDDNHIVPDVPTDFTINLSLPMFFDLNSVGNSVIVTSNYAGSLSAGYDGHGIIIYRAGLNEFYAFDRTCTFEQQLDVAVDLDLPTDMSAECPECGSRYILPSMGYPGKDGPATYPLKQYHAEYSNGTVWVHN